MEMDKGDKITLPVMETYSPFRFLAFISFNFSSTSSGIGVSPASAWMASSACSSGSGRTIPCRFA